MIGALIVWTIALQASAPTHKNLLASIDRSLPLLLKAAEGHIGKQTCFACHNQALPMLAFHELRQKGIKVEDGDIKEQTDFIHAFLKANKAKFVKGDGTGGQVDTAGYALLTLELGGRKPDEVTAAVANYILNYEPKREFWRVVSNRPPSEASHFTTTYLALRALRVWSNSEQRDAIAKRKETVRTWLLKTPPKDTEDRVFRMLAMKEAGVEDAVVRAAANALKDRQQRDGGWPQLDVGQSDAYATGTALFALRQIGALKSDEPGSKRGLTFLLRTQRADGSWYLKSRSSPFQPYYESGFPHGKDQFISVTASGWATAAIAQALN